MTCPDSGPRCHSDSRMAGLSLSYGWALSLCRSVACSPVIVELLLDSAIIAIIECLFCVVCARLCSRLDSTRLDSNCLNYVQRMQCLTMYGQTSGGRDGYRKWVVLRLQTEHSIKLWIMLIEANVGKCDHDQFDQFDHTIVAVLMYAHVCPRYIYYICYIADMSWDKAYRGTA